MRKTELLKALGGEFYAGLRAEGFRGSGATLRRIEPPLCHVFNVQGSFGGQGFFINLGVHLAFLPAVGGAVTEPGRLQEAQCAFRQRLGPAAGPRWEYPDPAYPLTELLRDLKTGWASEAAAFWSRYSPYPEAFERLVEEAVDNPPRPFEALQIARVARELGMLEEAAAISVTAIDRSTPAGTSLRGSLKRLLASLEVAEG